MINTAIAKLEAFNQIMSGGATNAQIAAFITAMRMKGETIDEITACAQVLREKCSRIHTQGDVLDIVGTGGDCANTFNISTTSAFVISAAGQPVAKHGNRSVSSKSGAADVLEALGVKIDLPAEKNEELLQKIILCFLFAESCHASMRYAGPVRKEIGIRTIFNIIGPLANPAWYARKSASEPFLISSGLWQTRPLQACSFWAFTRKNWCCRWRACFQTSALNAA